MAVNKIKLHLLLILLFDSVPYVGNEFSKIMRFPQK